MSLVWTKHESGFKLTRGGRTAYVYPLTEAADSRWLAFGPEAMIPSASHGPASWPSIEEAKAACEHALAPKRRGRKPGRTVRFSAFLPCPLVEAAEAEATRRGVKIAIVIGEWAERGRGAE